MRRFGHGTRPTTDRQFGSMVLGNWPASSALCVAGFPPTPSMRWSKGGVARLHWGGDPTGWASFSRLGSDHRVQSDPAMAPGSVCRPRHHDASVRCARTHRLTGQAALYNIQTGNKPNARPIEDRLPRLDAPSFVSSLVTPCRWIGRSSVDRVRQLAGFSCVFSEIRGHVGGHGVSDTASARFETQDSLSKVLGLAGPTSRQG